MKMIPIKVGEYSRSVTSYSFIYSLNKITCKVSKDKEIEDKKTINIILPM